MLFSRACEYGIRTMLHLASLSGDSPVLVRDVAEKLDISFPFLAKVVQTLARRGLINSHRGRGGGIALSRPSGDFTLRDVVEAIDGLALTQTCVLGLPECGDDAPCPLHCQWGDIRNRIVAMLSEHSLAEFSMELDDRSPVGDDGAS